MERWKKINVIGPEAEVSNLGRVRRRATCMKRILNEWVLVTPYRDKSGLQFVTFRKGNEQQNRYIHRLVARAFVKNPNNFPFVKFIDGDSHNVGALNLEWTRQPQRAIKNKRLTAILTEEKVSKIKHDLLKGRKQKDIAEEFGVHPSLISHINAGRKWK